MFITFEYKFRTFELMFRAFEHTFHDSERNLQLLFPVFLSYDKSIS